MPISGLSGASHSGYTLQDTDFADLRALQEKYGVALLPIQIKEEQ